MNRNTDNYSQAVLDKIERTLLNGYGTLQNLADSYKLSSGRPSTHMRKRGLVYDRKEGKWSKVGIIAEWKPALPDGYKINLQTGAVYKTNEPQSIDNDKPKRQLFAVDLSELPTDGVDTRRPHVLENYAAEFDRYTAVLEQSASALESVVEERDQLRKDNAELTAALHDITKRYEDQGRELLIARQDQEKWHSEKYRQDLAKIETTRKINKGIIDRTLEFIDRSKS